MSQRNERLSGSLWVSELGQSVRNQPIVAEDCEVGEELDHHDGTSDSESRNLEQAALNAGYLRHDELDPSI